MNDYLSYYIKLNRFYQFQMITPYPDFSWNLNQDYCVCIEFCKHTSLCRHTTSISSFTCFTLYPALALVSMNITLSSLALRSPSSVETCRLSERSVLLPTNIMITSLPRSVLTSSIHLDVWWNEFASIKSILFLTTYNYKVIFSIHIKYKMNNESNMFSGCKTY